MLLIHARFVFLNPNVTQCVSKVKTPDCVFWDYEADDGIGNWATNGCYLDMSEGGVNNPSCKCNHLTSFAVLMVSLSLQFHTVCHLSQ